MDRFFISAVLVAFFLSLTDFSHADYCLTYYSNNINTYYMYCANGCCGYAHDRECCKKTNAGAIAGGVIGALTAIAVIVGIIVYCHISKKKKKKEEEEIDEGFDFNMSEPEPEYLNHGFPGAPLGPPPAYDHPPPAPIGARGGPGDLPPPMPNTEHM
ncbi:uncharacterized protein LOC134235450 isoform X2 [Saccostrea cucullata]|uniref:uncharacterized protein LOC134235450 isoform X2 n=1 Tax=Saccostrea cuccullata TaxID=36930 RepID=UPI002ED63E4C